ncbi:Putative zinc-finger [Natronincola peptidivorans]|uniref:Putative zinc-finger n=1 Tax=Natronincola peptidivorans TaxID=426128 RepID=A0A1I0GK00_9FIRM|nr:anti sigma factor C-terminal domain-containing protein [Natronincola peptidivorans]SET70689.1 Putative zinc-finger [Natronincola peptidivorans]
MNCSDVEKKWQDYLNGTLNPEEEEKIVDHINICSNCNKKLDHELEEKKLHPHKIFSINEDKQVKILRRAKWKSRVSNAFSVISIFLMVTIVSMILSTAYFSVGKNRGNTAANVSIMVTELTMPNIVPAGSNSRVKSFFRMESSHELRKKIGYDYQTIGRQNTNMLFNHMNVQRDWHKGALEVKMYFIYPHSAHEAPYDDKENPAWETLEILPEGTVSELAVSFDKSYTLEEVFDIFEGYDLDLLWFAVETGIETDLATGPYLSVMDGLMGFPHFARSLVYEPESPGNYSLAVRGDAEKKNSAFIRGVEFLAEHQGWAEKAYRGSPKRFLLNERLEYLQENGVKIYGVVLTGPTKELLSLKEVEEIKYPVLGEVVLWNWYNRMFHGTIYN